MGHWAAPHLLLFHPVPKPSDQVIRAPLKFAFCHIMSLDVAVRSEVQSLSRAVKSNLSTNDALLGRHMHAKKEGRIADKYICQCDGHNVLFCSQRPVWGGKRTFLSISQRRNERKESAVLQLLVPCKAWYKTVPKRACSLLVRALICQYSQPRGSREGNAWPTSSKGSS